MKRIDQKKVEARITGMMAQLQPPEPAHMDDVKRRAGEEFFRRDELLRRRLLFIKHLMRNAGIAVAAAACLMALSVVYTIFAPVTVSNANNFVRRTSIWVNNALHLGLEFPVPVEDENTADLLADGEMVFDSVEAASKAIGLPLVHLAEESGAELVEVKVQMVEECVNNVSIAYCFQQENLLFVLRPSLSDQIVSVQDSEQMIETEAGRMMLWNNSIYIRGRMITEIWNVRLSTELKIDMTKDILRYLVPY